MGNMNQLLDVLIIGGGPAGLNAALVLGRARKNVVVIDDETPRKNWVTRETHGFVTRDGASPRNFGKQPKNRLQRIPQFNLLPIRQQR